MLICEKKGLPCQIHQIRLKTVKLFKLRFRMRQHRKLQLSRKLYVMYLCNTDQNLYVFIPHFLLIKFYATKHTFTFIAFHCGKLRTLFKFIILSILHSLVSNTHTHTHILYVRCRLNCINWDACVLYFDPHCTKLEIGSNKLHTPPLWET